MLRKKAEEKSGLQATEVEPQTVDEFVASAWQHYAKKEYFRAEADFQKALELSPGDPDILYALGMTLQASGRSPEAIDIFEKSIQRLNETREENPVRALMLTRLANGHINRIKTGDWKLSA